LQLIILIDKHTKTHTQKQITIGRTPLDEESARCRELYLTTHNNHKTKKFMPTVGFEPAILASEQPQTHALDHVATEIGSKAICE